MDGRRDSLFAVSSGGRKPDLPGSCRATTVRPRPLPEKRTGDLSAEPVASTGSVAGSSRRWRMEACTPKQQEAEVKNYTAASGRLISPCSRRTVMAVTICTGAAGSSRGRAASVGAGRQRVTSSTVSAAGGADPVGRDTYTSRQSTRTKPTSGFEVVAGAVLVADAVPAARRAVAGGLSGRGWRKSPEP